MFFTLIKNYFKGIGDSMIWMDFSPKKIKRVRGRFEVGEYVVDLDLLSSYNRREFKSVDSLVAHYSDILIKSESSLKIEIGIGLSEYFGILHRKSVGKKGEKSIIEFIEYFVLTDRSTMKGFAFKNKGVRTYINSIDIRTIADVRNDKLNKLLQIK